MIRIHRGTEPANLKPVRETKLDFVRAIARNRPPTSTEIDGYDIVKPDLWRMQHHKCCYCEQKKLPQFNDVEHYRPKARADRGPGFGKYGYWWLAWDWDNLLFSCDLCNRSRKSDQFPLAPNSVPLDERTEEQPPGKEYPLLLDPAADDPMDHIRFCEVKIHEELRWIPVAKNGSERGARTIATLKLDSTPELGDLLNEHARQFLLPAANEIKEVLSGTRPTAAKVRRLWNRRVLPLVAPSMPYAALSFDFFDQQFPEETRLRWRLDLPRP